MTDQNDYLKQPLDVRVSTVGTNSTDIEMKMNDHRETMEYAKEVEKERDNLKALVGELVECILNDGARVYPKTILNSLITTAESMIGGKTWAIHRETAKT